MGKKANKNIIAKRYAGALLGAAQESKSEAKVLADLVTLQEAIENSAELKSALSSQIASLQEKSALVKELSSKAKKQTITSNFLELLAEKSRLNLTSEIIVEFQKLYREANKTVEAIVTSAKKLTATEEKDIIKILEKKFDKKVEITSEIDESLIAGFVVKAGSELIDTSIKGRLNLVKNAL